jgi:hypothetical protein
MQPPVLDTLAWSADALERLDQLREARDQLDIMIEHAVRECRTNARGEIHFEQVLGEGRENHPPKPVPWQRIAEALGVSKQYAWERYRDI